MADDNPSKYRGYFKDLTGKRFGRLVVISLNPIRAHNGAQWDCICDCGTAKTIRSSYLIRGCTKSCGCLEIELKTKHGRCGTKEYKAWSNARSRCLNPNVTRFENHGGRGIRMDQRWASSFAAFYADMGPCPDGMTLDRIDNDGNYEPGNCRWTSPLTQARNQRRTIRVIHNGQLIPIRQLAEITGIHVKTLVSRYKRGQPLVPNS